MASEPTLSHDLGHEGSGAGGHEATGDHGPRASFWALALGSIGVVYGDIGTSPLYAFRQAAAAASGEHQVSQVEVFGVLSLIIWALVLVVTVKYVLILVRADNEGEGGTLSLMALAQRALGRGRPFIVVLGVVSAALFYGDAVITPALSVLSAVEGLEVVTPTFEPYIVPLTVVILILLFAAQSRGTAKVASLFGPITAAWFVIIGVAGISHIVNVPTVLLALNPIYALSFLVTHGHIGLLTLGAVFLAVTGTEALYADLGHFGRRPIQTAWLFLVLPSLALNYLGQGALVLANPAAIENPFFLMFPSWALLPIVVLATAATVIASQAVITGCYSITRQAIQLGLLPRLEIRHTSDSLFGQIYMPRVNSMLLLAVLLLVFLFRSSGALASAYGISVSGTMVVTSLLAFLVIWKVWGWSRWATTLLIAPMLAVDLSFFGANLLKVFEGGYVPILIGAVLMVLMLTWVRGTRILLEKTRRLEVPLKGLVKRLETSPPHRVPGTAVFLTADPDSTPTALLHSIKHYKVLHEHNIVLTIFTSDKPRVPVKDRVKIEPISETFLRLAVSYGYAESPNVPKAMAVARKHGLAFDIMSTSFFLSRRSVRPSPNSGMPSWQDKIFIALARNADNATNYFQIPTDRVVEIGTQVAV